MITKSVLNQCCVNDETINIKKEDFPAFVHDYIVENLSLPPKEVCRASYESFIKKNREYTIDGLLKACKAVIALDFKLQNAYPLNNNEFCYDCNFPRVESFIDNEDWGLDEMRALFYFIYYKDGEFTLTKEITTKTNLPDTLDIKRGVVECKQFIARAFLYSKVFIKLDEKEALNLSLRNIDKGCEALSLGIFITKVWEKMADNIDFFNAYY